MKPEDAKYHQFLWPDETTGEIKTYQMNRITFGDCCSPFVAIYATIKATEDYEDGKGDEENTRRELLSIVGGIFDPLGLASPMVFKAKIKLKYLYRRAIHILCLLDSPEEKTDEQEEPTQSVLGEHVPANIVSV